MDKEIEIAGKKTFYRVFGNGQLVVLVHGFGETGDVWKNQVDFLQDRFHLIVPDLPGSGQSEIIDDMSVEGMAEIIKVIIDAEVQKENINISESSKVLRQPAEGFRGALIGHSMGGYITLAFAEKYPTYLNSFGLFHSTAYPDNEEKKATRRKGIEFIKEHGAFEFLKTSIPNLFSADTKQRSPELIDQFIQSLNNFSPEALVSYYESMIKRPDRTHILKKTKIPILFVLGKYDTAVPLEDGLKQCTFPEKSYIHILHQSGHMGMLEEADKSNRILENFLSES